MQKQLQAETRNIQVLGFGVAYIRDLTVVHSSWPVHADIASYILDVIGSANGLLSVRHQVNTLTNADFIDFIKLTEMKIYSKF